MTTYKDIILSYNDEEWRLNRLKSVIDFITFGYEIPPLEKIAELEDDKGILNVYYETRLSTYEKLWFKWIWQDNNENIVIFKKYICPHCSQPPQKEDEEVKEYLNYLYNDNI
jgi:hypothetical protein